ncbi:hypothetical protein OROGR_012067 [Orobanche gracilis]
MKYVCGYHHIIPVQGQARVITTWIETLGGLGYLHQPNWVMARRSTGREC